MNASGAKDIVRNNETGFLVEENEIDFANALEKLIDDNDLRTTFSLNAKTLAQQNFTSSICAEKMLKVYEQNIEKRIL